MKEDFVPIVFEVTTQHILGYDITLIVIKLDN
jgi:hypothetical protein